MVFCNGTINLGNLNIMNVTILILVDGFLQCFINKENIKKCISHNPYFSRWFSAIKSKCDKNDKIFVTILILVDGFLQFQSFIGFPDCRRVTILILVDGFLQYNKK